MTAGSRCATDSTASTATARRRSATVASTPTTSTPSRPPSTSSSPTPSTRRARPSPSSPSSTQRLLAVTPEQKAWLDTVARQAVDGPGSISFRYEPFERNLHICSALLACCEAGLDDDDLRTLVEAVIGAVVQPTITTGAALGALTLAEAITPRRDGPTAAIPRPRPRERDENMFKDPSAGGDRIVYNDLEGALLLFTVKGQEDGIETIVRPGRPDRADVAVARRAPRARRTTTPSSSPSCSSASSARAMGEMVIGRLGKGNAKPGQSPPWTLAAATDADKAVGERYLAYAAQQEVEEEAPF